jgi:signal transduction histidine kinase
VPNRHGRLEGSSESAEAGTALLPAPSDLRPVMPGDGPMPELYDKLANAVNDERRRTARDIQAGVLQRLAAMRILATAELESRPETSRSLRDISLGLDTAMAELRDTVISPEPALISKLGLGGALKACGPAAAVDLRVEDRLRREYPMRSQLAVYFACREAIQNAMKHAGRQATVTVRLDDAARGLEFEVGDDGVGFDPSDTGRGVGLMNIRERLESAGGRVAIASRPGAGCAVSGFVPDALSDLQSDARSPSGVSSAGREHALRRQILLETDAERRRIMRDLHDGAQQRLVALRVRIALAADVAVDGSRAQRTIQRLGSDLDLAIAELRDLVRGLLGETRRTPVAPALRNVTSHWPMPVRVRARNVGRHDRAVEAALYGCVLEALQHTRANRATATDSSAVVSLVEAGDAIHFVVRGRGAGYDPKRRMERDSAEHIVDRASAAGGWLSLHALPGNGLLFRGSIPVGRGA